MLDFRNEIWRFPTYRIGTHTGCEDEQDQAGSVKAAREIILWYSERWLHQKNKGKIVQDDATLCLRFAEDSLCSFAARGYPDRQFRLLHENRPELKVTTKAEKQVLDLILLILNDVCMDIKVQNYSNNALLALGLLFMAKNRLCLYLRSCRKKMTSFAH